MGEGGKREGVRRLLKGRFWGIEVPAAETRLQTSSPFKTEKRSFFATLFTKRELIL